MIKVVADTNIYISALNFAGISDEILSLARKEDVELFISPAIFEELEGVLISKFAWTTERIEKALTEIKKFTQIVHPKEKFSVIKKDEADNRILECAQEAKAHFIVSGDRHLKGLKIFQGIKIVPPVEFLGLLESWFEVG